MTQAEIIGERIAIAREAFGYSQVELARAMRVQDSTINHYEKGRRTPSIAAIAKIARTTKVRAGYLLGLEDMEDAPVTTVERLFCLAIAKHCGMPQMEKIMREYHDMLEGGQE
jgi:transcriptional regulator with XRE-family HTH domain